MLVKEKTQDSAKRVAPSAAAVLCNWLHLSSDLNNQSTSAEPQEDGVLFVDGAKSYSGFGKEGSTLFFCAPTIICCDILLLPADCL